MTGFGASHRAGASARRMAGPPVEIYRQRPVQMNARDHDAMGVFANGRPSSLPLSGLCLSA